MKIARFVHQKGLSSVEFALSAAVFFFMMFGAIEVARAMFTWSALDAMTQRGARIAAVCPLNHASIAQTAIFGGNGALVPNITTNNIAVRYLTVNGNPTATQANTRFVEVSIQNYTHQMLIPSTITNFVAPLLTARPFTTLRPAESLGENPGGPDFCT